VDLGLEGKEIIVKGGIWVSGPYRGKEKDLLRIEEVRVVNEFRDIFLEELPGLPL